MAIKRITISVPGDVAERIKRAAGPTPVSAWVTGLIEEHLDDADLERQWQQFYADVSPSPQAQRRAKSLLEKLTKRRRGPSAA